MLLGNQSILRIAGYQGSSNLFELSIEGFVVQEDPVVIEFSVETVLDLPDGFGNLPDVVIPRESDESRICTFARMYCGRERVGCVGCLIRGNRAWGGCAIGGGRRARRAVLL